MQHAVHPPRRRPIASRDHILAKRLATALASAGVSPNSISVAGMLASVAGGIALAMTRTFEPAWPFFVFGAAMMQARLLANMFDGMVAIQTSKASPIGGLYNEVPDRVSDAAFFLGMGYAAGGVPELGFWAALLAVMTAYVRSEGAVAGSHQEYCGPMAKPHRMAISTCGCLLAAFLPRAWVPAWEAVPGAGVMAVTLAIIVLGCLVTIPRRLAKIAAALRKSTP